MPARFTVKVGAQNGVAKAAHWLVDGGIVKPEHWRKDQDLSATICHAISDIATRIRPDPLAHMDVILVDDVNEANLSYAHDRGKVGIGALIVRCNLRDDGTYHAVIGTTLKAMEAHRPGLGHAVLRYLHEALSYSARALDPVSGYGWAQSNYWMGEQDESMVVEENLGDAEQYWEDQQKKLPQKERKPFDPAKAAEQLEIFTRKDYDDNIPLWAGSEHYHKKALTLGTLARLRVAPRYRKIIRATIAAGKLIERLGHYTRFNDLNEFECCRWEICPYLLRWDKQDPLPQIWDDFMNNEFQAGETSMETNAVFAFHDRQSLIKSVNRFERWCTILQAAENLIRTINPKEL